MRGDADAARTLPSTGGRRDGLDPGRAVRADRESGGHRAFGADPRGDGRRWHRPRGLLLGLYQGHPLTTRTSYYGNTVPDRIFIYQDAIEQICRTEDEVVEQVRRTVLHEVAHHFGIDDDRLRELGMH